MPDLCHVVLNHTGELIHHPRIYAIFSRLDLADRCIAEMRDADPDMDLRYERHFLRGGPRHKRLDTATLRSM